jgi:fatty acid desaturase
MEAAENSGQLTLQAIYRLIPRSRLRELQALDTERMIGGLAFEWLGIAVAIWACERWFSLPLYLFTVLWISARILALGLVMHDGVHGLISRNRAANDWVTELFAAWPIFLSMRSYRIKHLAHHANLNTDQDPDWVAKEHPDWRFPMRPARLLTVLGKLATGIFVFDTFRVMSEKSALPQQRRKHPAPASYTAARAAFYVVVLGAILAAGHGGLLVKYWLVPIATGLQLLNRLRRVAEHSGIQGRPLELQTRTTLHGFWARLLLSPKNIAYHNEHHLYPGVPLYRLPELHRELMSHDLARESLHVTRSYLGVYRELVAGA